MRKNIINQSYSLQQKNVTLSNTVVRSAQGLTLVEKRILMAALAKMNGIFKPVKILALEYAEAFDVKPKQAYEQLKESVHNFRKRYITFTEKDKNNHILFWEINWLSAVAYPENEGYIMIEFNPRLMPYLCELEKQFTTYQLKQAGALRSIYSWRMLELLEQMKNRKDEDGWLNIPITDFWHAMEASETYRANFSLLRKRIIDPACKELIEKDGWLINWEALKTGKKVTSLKFNFKRDPQGRLAL